MRATLAQSRAKVRFLCRPSLLPCALFLRCLDRVHQPERPPSAREGSSQPNADRGCRAIPGQVAPAPVRRRRKFPSPDADEPQVPAATLLFFRPREIAFCLAVHANVQGGTRKINKPRTRTPNSTPVIVVSRPRGRK